jgi:hypothetical protein
VLTDTLADLDKKAFHKHWGSPQVLVQDRKDLAPVVELDTVVGAQHKEGHCDGTVGYSTEDPGALGTA